MNVVSCNALDVKASNVNRHYMHTLDRRTMRGLIEKSGYDAPRLDQVVLFPRIFLTLKGRTRRNHSNYLLSCDELPQISKSLVLTCGAAILKPLPDYAVIYRIIALCISLHSSATLFLRLQSKS